MMTAVSDLLVATGLPPAGMTSATLCAGGGERDSDSRGAEAAASAAGGEMLSKLLATAFAASRGLWQPAWTSSDHGDSFGERLGDTGGDHPDTFDDGVAACGDNLAPRCKASTAPMDVDSEEVGNTRVSPRPPGAREPPSCLCWSSGDGDADEGEDELDAEDEDKDAAVIVLESKPWRTGDAILCASDSCCIVSLALSFLHASLSSMSELLSSATRSWTSSSTSC